MLASDGVWEHLGDQAVIEMVEGFHGAGEPANLACTNVIARSAVAWRMEEGPARSKVPCLAVPQLGACASSGRGYWPPCSSALPGWAPGNGVPATASAGGGGC